MLGRIAIHLSDDKACERRIKIGLNLAKSHNAEAIGVYPSPLSANSQTEEHMIPQELRQALRGRQEENRDATRIKFLEMAQELGVKSQWRAPKGDAEESLAIHARYCDLVVMSKTEHFEGTSAFKLHLPESVVMAAGRPVLMLPNFGDFETIGKRVLYCWDQKRESARALTDAAPFLSSCDTLTVLEIDRDDKLSQNRDLSETDITDYCASLGYPKAQHLIRESTGFGVGNIILNTATDTDADLIVMGAYGHSRMRQWIMGGATSTLLSSMTIPVLLAN